MTARFQQIGLMSIADRVVRGATGRGREAAGSGSSTSAAAAPLTFAVASGQRELRLDLFRGLALWLIYIDHVSPDILTWGTIRNYGFSDAAASRRRCRRPRLRNTKVRGPFDASLRA